MSCAPLFCGKAPRNLYFEPCCLEPDHDGPCRVWKQEPWDHTHEDSTYGIRTYEERWNGARLIQAFETKGKFSPEEVAAIVQYVELLRRPPETAGAE